MASPEPIAISVELGEGQEPVRLRWEPADDDDAPVAKSPWRVESEPDWERLEGIRLLSARFDDGRALAVAALRPRGVEGHGDDLVIARLLDAEGEWTSISEALVSVEYDAGGEPRRLGIELWPDSESAPLRVAADRDTEADPGADGDRDAVAMAFRLDGSAGSGIYEVLRRN